VPTSQRVPAGGRLDGLDDVFGRADMVGQRQTSKGRFRVGDDQAVGMLVAEAQDVAGLEHLVHRAVALPQQDAGACGSARR
jgi:hypothetical protein